MTAELALCRRQVIALERDLEQRAFANSKLADRVAELERELARVLLEFT